MNIIIILMNQFRAVQPLGLTVTDYFKFNLFAISAGIASL